MKAKRQVTRQAELVDDLRSKPHSERSVSEGKSFILHLVRQIPDPRQIYLIEFSNVVLDNVLHFVLILDGKGVPDIACIAQPRN